MRLGHTLIADRWLEFCCKATNFIVWNASNFLVGKNFLRASWFRMPSFTELGSSFVKLWAGNQKNYGGHRLVTQFKA